MTQWNHIISRLSTTAPAWRQAMTATNTVYEVGDDADVSASKIVWPAAGANNFLMNGGGDSNPALLHFSYGSSVFVPELGAFGTMIFGSTGEACVTNQLTQWSLSDDAPTWDFFQQPEYAISSAEAISVGADAYYSEADYAALASDHKISDEAAFSATWDGSFPVGYKNWVIRRKHTDSFTGNVRPHWFRYDMPRYIPPAMTGTANGAIVVTQRSGIYGPFGQGPTPSGATASQWFANVWGSGNPKYPLHAIDVVTKGWQKLSTFVPDFTGYTGDTAASRSCVDEANKRIYYQTYNGSNHATYYADFSSGLAGMTVSSPLDMTDLAGGPGLSQGANSLLVVPTIGPNAGRRLWYFKSNSPNMALMDLDTNTLRVLAITGLPSFAPWWDFSYDAAGNRLIITVMTSGAADNYIMSIPTDPTDAASYSVTHTSLSFASGVTQETAAIGAWQYGERCKYLPDPLGVILITQLHGPMLAYRPA